MSESLAHKSDVGPGGREVACVVLICAIIIALLHARHGPDADNGVILDGAWDLVNGRRIYVDFFEFVPPGSFYLVYAVWKLLGVSYWSAKALGCVALFVGAIGVHRIVCLVSREAARQTPTWVRVWIPALFCALSTRWPVINHHTFSLVFAIWSAYCACLGLQRQNAVLMGIGGLLAGVSVWFIQFSGVALAAGTGLAVLIVWLRDRQPVWLFNGAIFLVGAVAGASTLLMFWPVELLWENLIAFPADRYMAINWVNPMPLILAAVALILVGRLSRDRLSAPIIALIAVQGFLLASTVSRPGILHVSMIAFPFLCLLAPVLIPETTQAAMARLWPAVAYASLAAIVLTQPTVFPRRADFPFSSYIEHNCADSPYLYAGPFLAGLHFETRKINPTRYYTLLTGFNTEAQFAEARADLARHRPQCIMVEYSGVVQFGYDRQNPVEAFIRQNYKTGAQFGTLEVLQRIDG